MKPLIIVGYMASGKSTIGRKLAHRLGLNFIDTDIFIENRFRKRIVDLFELWGEDTFREREHIITQEVVGIQDVVISTGGGLPCYHNNMDILLSEGTTIYLDINNENLTERLELCKRTRPTVRNKRIEEIKEYIDEAMIMRRPIYEKSHLIIDSNFVKDDYGEEIIVTQIIDTLKNQDYL